MVYSAEASALSAAALFDLNMAKTGAGQRVRKLVGVSQEILRRLPLGAFDFIYVDGSHAGDDVLEDAVLSYRLLKSGGLLVFDDYGSLTSASEAIDAFRNLFAERFELVHKGYQLTLRKR
jgi:predicted O-methyltransferase YrrM